MSSCHFPATILGQNKNRKWSPSYRGLSVDCIWEKHLAIPEIFT